MRTEGEGAGVGARGVLTSTREDRGERARWRVCVGVRGERRGRAECEVWLCGGGSAAAGGHAGASWFGVLRGRGGRVGPRACGARERGRGARWRRELSGIRGMSRGQYGGPAARGSHGVTLGGSRRS